MTADKKPALSIVQGGKMYEDTPEADREEWEDHAGAFVPAFVPVKVVETVYRNLDAHLVIDENGILAVRIMDDHENPIFTFPLAGLFQFDTEQYAEESWEQYFGLIEVMNQLTGIRGAFDASFIRVGEIMKLRKDAPPQPAN
jgi:hypothetical protein